MPAAGAHCACWGVTSLPLGLLLPGGCALPVGLSKLCQSLWQTTGPGWVVCRWVAFPCPFQAAQLPWPSHSALNRFHNHHPVLPCATGTSIHPWTSWLPCYPAWCSISGESASLPQLLAEGPGQGDGQKTRIWGWGSCPCKLASCKSSCCGWRGVPGNVLEPAVPHMDLSMFPGSSM